MKQKFKKKSIVRKALRTLILHIDNFKKLKQIGKKKLFNKKNSDVTFSLSEIKLPICSNTYEFFQIF